MSDLTGPYEGWVPQEEHDAALVRLAVAETALREGQAIYDKFEDAPMMWSVGLKDSTAASVQMELDRWCYRTFGPNGVVSVVLVSEPAAEETR